MRRYLFAHPVSHLMLLGVLVAATTSATNTDWPQYRGPESAGASNASGVFPTAGFGLEIAWRRPIGAAYSEVSVLGQRAVTMFADGEVDVIAAFDVDTGDELWRHTIGETYKGHTGSDGGPISTPAIADGSVYGLGPHGDLFALDLASGAVHWTHRLTDEESKQPYYGFTSSPLVVDDLLIVQLGGGDGHSITAFDRATGKARWRVGDDRMVYESPIVTMLAGKRQVVAAGGDWVVGLDPRGGQALWRWQHKLDGVLGTPILLGDDGLLLRGDDEAVALDVRQVDGALQATELWRSNDFKRSFALPVVHEGYAYGMSRNFLTCLDTRDGRLVWRSRPPGGNVLILVDGHLALVGSDGELVVAKATPEGFDEVARTAIFDGDTYSAPSFSGDRFFLRDVTSFAAVRIVTQGPVETAAIPVDADRYLGPFGDILRDITALPLADRQARIDAVFQDRASGPIVEAVDNIGFAHLVYRGEAQDVGLSGNLPGFRWDDEEPLHRLEGTDLFFRSFRMDPAGIWQYQMSTDFGDKSADPGNPRYVKIRDAKWSVLSLPNAPAKPHLDALPTDTPRGRTENFTLASKHFGNEREITVYLPPGYPDAGKELANPERFPLLIYTRANLRDLMHFEQTLDTMIATGAIEPPVVAFVPRRSGTEHGTDADTYVAMLVEELLPELQSRFRLREDRLQRALAGAVSGAGVAVYTGLRAGDHFGKVAVQSFLAGELEAVFEPRDASGLEVYIELRSDDVEEAPAATARILDVLRAGGATVKLANIAGGVGPTGWRTTLDQVLIALFGKDR